MNLFKIFSFTSKKIVYTKSLIISEEVLLDLGFKKQGINFVFNDIVVFKNNRKFFISVNGEQEKEITTLKSLQDVLKN